MWPNYDVLHGLLNYSKIRVFGGLKKMSPKPLTLLSKIKSLFTFSGNEEAKLKKEYWDYDGSDYSRHGEVVKVISFYVTGEKKVESHIDKKEKTVTTTGFYKSGMRKYLKDYKDEKEHGLWVEWYPNGKMKISKKFLVGKENGPWTEWSEDGKITFQGNFKDGNEQ